MSKEKNISKEISAYQAALFLLSRYKDERLVIISTLAGIIISSVLFLRFSVSNLFKKDTTNITTPVQNNLPSDQPNSNSSINCNVNYYPDKVSTNISTTIIIPNSEVTCDQVNLTTKDLSIINIRPLLSPDKCLENAYFFAGNTNGNQAVPITVNDLVTMLTKYNVDQSVVGQKNIQVNKTDAGSEPTNIYGYLCL